MNINILIKGIIIGIAKIIPGLSGSLVMISFNLYDKAIEALTNFFTNTKKNFIFLTNLSIGILIGIIFFSKVISYLLTNNSLYTFILLIGLIAGGIPTIYKEVNIKKDYIIIILSFIISLIVLYLPRNNYYIIKNTYEDVIIFIISGFIEAIGTIVPGISSTALLLLIGVYDYYLNILSNILNITILKTNLILLISFTIGLFIGSIIITLLINYLLKHHRKQTFASILGITLSTILILLINKLTLIINLRELIICTLLFIGGFIITIKLN